MGKVKDRQIEDIENGIDREIMSSDTQPKPKPQTIVVPE